ncbi:hypothetical protein ACTD5D_02470 [Nocardia takedensis]|uniref:hypothetical protein n=1 Tax=Nocardia TaxID=1817 RepID=UPI002454C2C4|nr:MULTISPECIES: hypothetical protein [Nocardia]
MKDPIWLKHAHAALTAAVDKRSDFVGIEVARLLSDENVGSDGLILAALYWIDRMIEASPPDEVPAPAPVPDIWPADMALSQRWAVRLVASRINNDPDTAQALIAEAAADFDYLSECMSMLVILAGMSLGGRLAPGSRSDT